MAKLARTNENIIKELKKNGLKVNTSSAWNYLVEGTIKGRKVSIGCSRLTSLIEDGKLLPKYITGTAKF